MMRFTYKAGDNAPEVEVSMSPYATLSEVLEQFEGFLRAAGYQFDGMVDILLTEDEIEAVDSDESFLN